MKRFKKLVAVLLACVMALTLLTACGGGGSASGGSSNSGEDVMKQLTAKINENTKDYGIVLTYDTQLDNRAAICGNVLIAKYEAGASDEEATAAAMQAAGINEKDYYIANYNPNGAAKLDMDKVASVLAGQIVKEYHANKKVGKKIGYAGLISDSGDLLSFYALVACK